LLNVFAEQPGIRLTYDRGELEMMAPLFRHDNDGRFLGRLVIVLTEELNLPLVAGGSVTLRRRRRRRGLEPDDCFWIANAPRMGGRQQVDLRVDPPPDLAIEVDLTRSSLDRLTIYAALKVPEVWRLEGDLLTFYLLGADGKYTAAAASGCFPMVTSAELLGFLQEARQSGDHNVVIRRFREWIRARQGASGLGPSLS
jgi:Uma2 family endonuclease